MVVLLHEPLPCDSLPVAPFPAMAARVGVEYFLAEDHCEPPGVVVWVAKIWIGLWEEEPGTNSNRSAASKMSFALMTADLSNFCPGVGKGFIKAAMQVLGIAEVAPVLDDEGPGGYLEAVLKGNKNSTSMFDLKELRAEFIVDGILKRYTDKSVLIIKRDVRIGKVTLTERQKFAYTIKEMELQYLLESDSDSELETDILCPNHLLPKQYLPTSHWIVPPGIKQKWRFYWKNPDDIWIMWPSKDECKGSSQVMQLEGSYHDPYVFGQIDITINSENYFVPVPAYRVSNCSTPAKTEFNKRLAQEMRNHLRTPKEMKYLTQWVSACVVLHNLLAKIGDK
ncbi:hypothetical protein BY996DRAFT_6593612 [Phakopsora pachyrhizi]|nr:hypothetical protein BY996DRAFT_6593612 [Phakopsora pachyrhizi]